MNFAFKKKAEPFILILYNSLVNHITLPQMELIALPNGVKQNKTSNKDNCPNLVHANSAGKDIILLLFLVIDAPILC